MAKMRVYELSKEVGVSNKEIILTAKKLGLELKSHSSSIEEEYIQRIKDSIGNSESVNGSTVKKEEGPEEVKIFKSETGQEVVERRKGSRVVLRKKKKVEKTEETLELKDDEEIKVKADLEQIVEDKDKKEAKEHVEGIPEPVSEALKEEVEKDISDTKKKKASELKEITEKPDVEGKSSADEGVVQEVSDITQKEDFTEEEPKKKKKAKRVKISKEEIIDEDTLEELRRAFRTKLPTRKKEYVVDDRKTKSRVSEFDKKNKHGKGKEFSDAKSRSRTESNEARTEGIKELQETEKKPIKIGESITVGELAKRMGIKSVKVIKKLIQLGTPATINQEIDTDTAFILAEEFGFKIEVEKYEEEDFLIDKIENEELLERPPVVTVMGHVDHGKTTLLDSIRETSVVEGEAGGITQHIGAYKVSINNKDIVFIDTPGHEAFTSMRARGASITDIVILVVAADDGVMPQTIEAINHAQAAGVPIIVAINKIDKEGAEPEKIKRQLSEHGLISEEWGGDTLFSEVSAKSKQGIKELLELILLQADVLELKAVKNKRANGVVVEAKLDKGKGAIATVIVTEGTLKIGDYVVSDLFSGRVRGLKDDSGKDVKDAGPSEPVEIMGLSGVPTAGERFYVVKDEKTAKEVITNRENKLRKKTTVPVAKVSLDQLFEDLDKDEVKELFLVIKGDTQGSVEALTDSILKLNSEKCTVNIVHSGVGGINETDVVLASASNAVVVGFNVRPDNNALKIAEKEGVSLELHNIIYDVVSRIKSAMEGLLEPILNEVVTAHAEVKETFHISKVGAIAGCMVTDGKVERDNNIRILRDSVQIYDGKIDSLRRFKDDVKEVQAGYECGISVVNYNDIKIGDIFELYKYEEIKQEL